MNNQTEPVADNIIAAGNRLSVSRSLIYRELAAGRLTAVKAGGRVLILRAEQDRWLAALPKARAAEIAA